MHVLVGKIAVESPRQLYCVTSSVCLVVGRMGPLMPPCTPSGVEAVTTTRPTSLEQQEINRELHQTRWEWASAPWTGNRAPVHCSAPTPSTAEAQ